MVPLQEAIRLNGHALQCRVTTEDPENGFCARLRPHHRLPQRGRTGVRLDGGTAYSGAVITPYYDSLLVEGHHLGQYRGRGGQPHGPRPARVPHPRAVVQPGLSRERDRPPGLRLGTCTTRFIDETPELFEFAERRDRATRLLEFPIGEVTVNGNAEMKAVAVPR